MNETMETQRLLETLPLELYEMIWNLTFKTTKFVTIDPEYNPPVQLQINKATRKQATAKFFSETTFYVHDIWTFRKWIQSLTTEARNCLTDVISHPGISTQCQVALFSSLYGEGIVMGQLATWIFRVAVVEDPCCWTDRLR